MANYYTEVMADAPACYARLGDAPGATVPADSTGKNTGSVYYGGGTLGEPGLLPNQPGNTCFRTSPAAAGYATMGAWPYSGPMNAGDVVTVEAWIKLASLTGHGDMGIADKGQGSYYLRVQADNRLAFLWSYNANLRVASNPFATVGPHHVVATKSGSTVLLYVDGVEVPTAVVTNGTLTNTDVGLNVGGKNVGGYSGEFFDGWIDELAIYPVALSAARILAHYQAGIAAPPPPEGPVNLKTIMGRPKADAKTVRGMPLAEVKTWAGVS